MPDDPHKRVNSATDANATSVDSPVYRMTEASGVRLVDVSRRQTVLLRRLSAVLWEALADGMDLPAAIAYCARLTGRRRPALNRWACLCLRRWTAEGWVDEETNNGQCGADTEV
jgi:hypothetical protein